MSDSESSVTGVGGQASDDNCRQDFLLSLAKPEKNESGQRSKPCKPDQRQKRQEKLALAGPSREIPAGNPPQQSASRRLAREKTMPLLEQSLLSSIVARLDKIDNKLTEISREQKEMRQLLPMVTGSYNRGSLQISKRPSEIFRQNP
ncbi:MAG: hypothetical protein [Hangzhou altica cyanea chuvirus 1]|nr:MAG: hypothetical protein [Hangzhou altica cyanea chuvirus 1]